MAEERTFNEGILEKYRRILFPEIGNGIISGYNVYLDRPTRTMNFLVEYLHSELSKDEHGETHVHRIELYKRLDDLGNPNISEIPVRRIVDRMAIYRQQTWGSDPDGSRYFDKTGNSIPVESLLFLPPNSIILVEGKQYQLSIEIDEIQALNELLDAFNQYANFFTLDVSGLSTGQENPNAIHSAWEVPLVIVSASRDLVRPDYSEVTDFVLSDVDHLISSLLPINSDRLERVLELNGLFFDKQLKYANRQFVNSYLENIISNSP